MGPDAVERIRADMDRRGWSQRDLADKALVGESTVFRLLKGEFTTKTLRKVERALGIDVTDATALAHAFARIEYGGYARELYAYYERDYVCVRPSFTDPAKVTVYPLKIMWDGERGALVFLDRNSGYEQSGVITVPTGTQFLHFVTLDKGSARLITAYHMPENDPVIRGMVMTFANPQGRQLQPAAAPLVMLPLATECEDDPVASRIRRPVDALAEVSGLLARTDPRLAPILPDLDAIGSDPFFLAE
ncbi:MAG: helix-turn-helix transcriptional regulator [Pseudomonadota bacterium]